VYFICWCILPVFNYVYYVRADANTGDTVEEGSCAVKITTNLLAINNAWQTAMHHHNGFRNQNKSITQRWFWRTGDDGTLTDDIMGAFDVLAAEVFKERSDQDPHSNKMA
jgi:hypothetical protein